MNSPLSRQKIIKNLLVSLVPIIIFYVVEKYYGVAWGVIIAILSSIIECGYEYFKYKKIEPVTLGVLLLIVIMGSLSLYTGSGVFYKLNPAVYELAFALLFIGTSLWGTPILILFSKKQLKGVKLGESQIKHLKGMNLRIGIFFLVHGALTVYSALFLSTAAWAFIKGFLFYIMFFIYFGFEFLNKKRELQKKSPVTFNKYPIIFF